MPTSPSPSLVTSASSNIGTPKRASQLGITNVEQSGGGSASAGTSSSSSRPGLWIWLRGKGGVNFTREGASCGVAITKGVIVVSDIGLDMDRAPTETCDVGFDAVMPSKTLEDIGKESTEEGFEMSPEA